MAGADVPDEIPREWVERVRSEAGYQVPATLTDQG
jgi:hypothetical protein